MRAHPTPDDSLVLERLAQRESQLLSSLTALHADDEPAAMQEVSDFKDQAQRSMDAERDRAQTLRLEASIEGVMAARQRLAQGRYGICTECGEPIDEGRLQALPEVALCRTCQARHEAP